MNEEVSERSIRFAGRTSKLGARGLLKLLKMYMRHRKNKAIKKQMGGQGKQKVKDLIRQGQGVSSMDVSDESVRTFKRIANKYGVDFAIVKDKDSNPPKFTVFFKAKDADAITQVMKEYSAKIVKRKKQRQKPSILQKLKKLKDIIAKQPRKEKEKKKEQVL